MQGQAIAATSAIVGASISPVPLAGLSMSNGDPFHMMTIFIDRQGHFYKSEGQGEGREPRVYRLPELPLGPEDRERLLQAISQAREGLPPDAAPGVTFTIMRDGVPVPMHQSRDRGAKEKAPGYAEGLREFEERLSTAMGRALFQELPR